EGTRRLGVTMKPARGQSQFLGRLNAFVQRLQQLGWTDGRNLRIDARWGAGDADRYRTHAAELIALAPDVIVTATSGATGAVRKSTRTVPIVFVQVVDPVGGGFVDDLAKPGG